MKNKFNLDLVFLYQEPLKRDFFIALDRDEEFEEWIYKYEKEQDEFYDFTNKCSTDDLIYMFIKPFVEKYPRVFKIALSIASDYQVVDEDIYKFVKFKRNDIKRLETELEIGPIKNKYLPEDRDTYDKKITIEFTKSFSQNAVIEALKGKEYTQANINGLTTYIVKNSPIDRLEVSDKGFTILINPLMKIYY